MKNYKNSFGSLKFLALVPLLALSGCFKPAQHSVDDGDSSPASFYLEKVSGSAEVASLVPGFSIPNKKLFNMSVCVKSRLTDDKVAGERFTITGGESEQNARTDTSGCLSWSEPVSFNYLGDEKYLEIRRQVIAKGMQNGSREIRLAINPWRISEDSKDLIDLAYDKTPEGSLVSLADSVNALQGASKDGSTPTRNLYVSSISIENVPRDEIGSIGRLFKVKIAPVILRADIRGRPTSSILLDAKLNVTARLIESVTVAGVEKQYTVWQSAKPSATHLDGDRLRADLPIAIRQGNPSSRYFLSMKVQPVDGPKDLGAFEGLFEIGNFNKITGSSSLDGTLKNSNGPRTEGAAAAFSFDDVKSANLALNGNSSVASNLSGVAGENTNLPSGVSTAKLFGITKIVPTWGFAMPGETVTQRTVEYSVMACMTDSSNGGQPAIGVPFEVEKSDGTKEKPVGMGDSQSVDTPGCISWTNRIAHHYYAPEQYFLDPVTIRHYAANGKVDFELKRQIAINPWERWNFSKDLNTPAEKKIIDDVNGSTRLPTKLIADTFSTDTEENFRYEVDQYLSLQTIKRVILRIPLMSHRQSNILNGLNVSPEPMRPGLYMVKAAIYMKARNAAGQDTEVVIPVRGHAVIGHVIPGGVLKVDADFPISDPAIMKARLNLLFQVSLLDESLIPEDVKKANGRVPSQSELERYVDKTASIDSPVYAGPYWMKDEKDGSPVRPTADFAHDMPDNDTPNWYAVDLDQWIKDNPKSAPPKRIQVAPATHAEMRPLANLTMEQVFAKADLAQAQYQQRMNAMAKVSSILSHSNAEYVSITHENETINADQQIATNNRAIPNRGALPALLKVLNSSMFHQSARAINDHALPLAQPVTDRTLLDFIEGRRDLDVPLAARFCVFFMQEVSRSSLPPGSLSGAHADDTKHWVDDCILKMTQKDRASSLAVQRTMRIFDHEAIAHRHEGAGRIMNFSIGSDVSMSQSKGLSAGWGYGWSPIGMASRSGELSLYLRNIVGGATTVATTVAKTSFPIVSLLAAAPGALGMGADIHRGYTQSSGTSTGESVSSGVTLQMEQFEVAFGASRYERCAIVRPSQELLQAQSARRKYLDKVVGAERAADIMGRGLMLCTGYQDQRPAVVKERYYAFSQGIGDTVIADKGQIQNQPWLLTLRGQRDYASFLLAIEGKKTINQAKQEMIDIGDQPLAMLGRSYDTYLAGQVASHPSVYTIESRLVMQQPATQPRKK